MKEIGSEYWESEEVLKCNNFEFWNIGKDVKFTLSGRTSIYYVLKNILLKKNIQKVYMPSYSCSSMIQAFDELGIEIKYYDVYYNEGLKYNINLNEECDIFFAMNYFGYSETNMENYIQKFKQKGKIIIEDITHSILSEKRFSENSDYLVGSLRKWFPIATGGIAVSKNSVFEIDLKENLNTKLINIKSNAMKNKKIYIENNQGSKEEFLNQYAKSNKILFDDYKDYTIDSKSYEIIMGTDLQKIKLARRENVKVIYKNLKNQLKIKFLVDKYNENDCLLFVPIIIDTKLRDELRAYLIKKNIYLPVHWPLEKELNNIYKREISLICDQRYSVNDIKKYTNIILDFINENK